MIVKTVGFFVVGLVVAVLVTMILALPVQLLWNWVMPNATYWAKEITWLEAWGLMLLCYILVKSDIRVERNKD